MTETDTDIRGTIQCLLSSRWVVEAVIDVDGSAGRFKRVKIRSHALPQFTLSFEVDAVLSKVPSVGAVGKYQLKVEPGIKGVVL